MRKTPHTTLAAALVALTGACFWAPPVQALNTKPMNLSDLVRESSQIVVGTVSAVNQGLTESHLPYTEVSVTVSETILGSSVTTLTFRQFGLQAPLPAADGRRYVGLVAGMPQYKAGDAVVLFLSKTSSIGYRTTIGLGQGRFALRGGNLLNDANNAGLFKNLDLSRYNLNDKERHLVTTTEGAIGAEPFLSFLRRGVAGKWWNAPIRRTRPPTAPRSTVPKVVTVAGGLNP